MEDKKIARCAECRIKVDEKICISPQGRGPDFCPTLNLPALIRSSLNAYHFPEYNNFARLASVQEGECYVNREPGNPKTIYAIKTRVQETIEFAKKMNYKRLGLAFCSGLRHEAKILNDILKFQEFDVVSVACSVGRTVKEYLGVKDEQKVRIGKFEGMCSPITQAAILNEAETEFNIVMGLCVGHDALFFRFVKALTTVLVVKDRVTGHNPVAALYLNKTYYKKMGLEKFGKGGAVCVTPQLFKE